MDRGPLSHLLSWLLLGVGAAVALSALSLPLQPYTGLAVQGERIASVVPGSPGDRAGLRPGDRIRVRERSNPLTGLRGPLSSAIPAEPLGLDRTRNGETAVVEVVPESLPESERRLLAAMLAVACGFLLLGGWVWSERRDRLTRAFLLLCLAFAWLIVPLPSTRWPLVALAHEVVLAGATVLLPALFMHFFALFPESRQARGRLGAWVSAGYLVAAALFAGTVITLGLAFGAHPAAQAALLLVQAAAALWFAAGLLLALILFARSYVRANSSDTRRRLRVVFAGTVMGVAPLAALILFRNLSPETGLPGERWAVVLTLLVPASFAWATVVHRIFDFRVAVRSGAVVLVLAAAGVLAYFGSEWIAASWWPELGAGMAGGSLAFIALAAALIGPANPWLRGLSDEARAPQAASLEGATRTANGRSTDTDRTLAGACASIVESMGLDGCAAFAIEEGALRLAARCGGREELDVSSKLAQPLRRANVPTAVDDLGLDAADRFNLESADVRWVLPIGNDPPRAVLLLGGRLSGPWFGTHEVQELERFADHLEVALENAELRRAASTRSDMDRALMKAKEIQSHYLPRHVPVYATLDCAAAALAVEPVGGDYYDFVETSDRSFTLAVGDARGHGVPAAITLAGVQARFRTEAQRGPRPGDLLSALNQELVKLDHPENFVCMLCARYEARSGRLSFANAGLTPPLVRRRDGTVEELTDAGVLLGVSEGADYPNASTMLGAGDVALVYTDGLTEAQRGEEMFGVERVQDVLGRNAHRRARDIMGALMDEVRAWADQPLDDMTVVVLKQLTDLARTASPAAGKGTQGTENAGRYRQVRRQEAVSPVRAANPRAADHNG